MSDKPVTTKAPCEGDWITSPPHQFEIIDKIEEAGWFGSKKVRVIYKCKACGRVTENGVRL